MVSPAPMDEWTECGKVVSEGTLHLQMPLDTSAAREAHAAWPDRATQLQARRSQVAGTGAGCGWVRSK
jgi:hypothetical protein